MFRLGLANKVVAPEADLADGSDPCGETDRARAAPGRCR